MSKLTRPPRAFEEFVQRYPRIGKAWDLVNEEGATGPLDEKVVRLVKLAVAIGHFREGAVHAAVRKAMAKGATAAELEQVVALASATLGFPGTVAVFGWVREELGKATAAK